MAANSQISRSPAVTAPRVAGKPVGLRSSERIALSAVRSGPTELDIDQFLISSGEAIVSRFRKSESIFAQGDPADSVIYLRAGTAKMMVVSDHGKEATISVLRTGDFCGEGCLIEEPLRLQTVMTMVPCATLRVPKKSFSKLLREYPEFSSTFTRFLLLRSIRIQQDLVNQRFHSSEFRLARLLIGLSIFSGPNLDQQTITRISQETLASMVGTTRSRISFFLNKFKKAGWIEYEGGIRVKPALDELFQSRKNGRY